jgi:hypothetical protein
MAQIVRNCVRPPGLARGSHCSRHSQQADWVWYFGTRPGSKTTNKPSTIRTRRFVPARGKGSPPSVGALGVDFTASEPRTQRMASVVPVRQRGRLGPVRNQPRRRKEDHVSPRKREPAPTDHATMLDLALEDLQRATSLGRELLHEHPDRAHAALDLLLINIGCWEVRWLSMANAAAGVEHAHDMPLSDADDVSTLDFTQATEMSTRARDLVISPGKSRRRTRDDQREKSSHHLPGQISHAASREMPSHLGD